MKIKILNWLNTEFINLEIDETNDCVFFEKNEKSIFRYDKKNAFVYISATNLWYNLENKFNISDAEIETITKDWVNFNYKLNVKKIICDLFL